MRKIAIFLFIILSINICSLNVFALDDLNDDNMQDYIEAYAPVLCTYLSYLDGNQPEMVANTEHGDYYMVLEITGISLLSRYTDSFDYCLIDIDNNSIPELIISSQETKVFPNYIFDMFTLVDNTPVRVVSSSNRVRYQLRSDNTLYYEGSSGAGYTINALYTFSNNELKFIDGIVHSYNEELNTIEHYEIFEERNNIFTFQPDTDKILTQEECQQKQEQFSSSVVTLNLSPLTKNTIYNLNEMAVFYLPNGLVTIEDEAFSNISCEAVVVPSDCYYIGNSAFKDCSNLKYIEMPQSAEVAENAFSGCNNLIINRFER